MIGALADPLPAPDPSLSVDEAGNATDKAVRRALAESRRRHNAGATYRYLHDRLYGSRANDGVVQIFTKHGGGTSIALSSGSFGTTDGSASIGHRFGDAVTPLDIGVSISGQTTNGYSARDANVDPSANPDRDSAHIRPQHAKFPALHNAPSVNEPPRERVLKVCLGMEEPTIGGEVGHGFRAVDHLRVHSEVPNAAKPCSIIRDSTSYRSPALLRSDGSHFTLQQSASRLCLSNSAVRAR